jgi:hypothetical protein
LFKKIELLQFYEQIKSVLPNIKQTSRNPNLQKMKKKVLQELAVDKGNMMNWDHQRWLYKEGFLNSS